MNSSEIATEVRLESAGSPLIRLLMAMSAEWTMIAREVEALGHVVSAHAVANDVRAAATDIQAFDLIHQRAQGQANLLKRLSRKLAEDQYFDRRRVDDLIAEIPFQSVRAGLEAAFDGRPAPPETQEGGDDVDWL